MHDSHKTARYSLSMKVFLVSAARLYKRVINPIGFIARSFVQEVGGLLPAMSAKTRSCLDIGAGIAPYEAALRKHIHVGSYIALDVASTDRTNVIADCLQLPFKSKSIDIVVSFDVIQHIENPELMLDEACRVIKGGGHLILTYPFLYPECDARDFRRWTVEGMRALLISHGFEIVTERRRAGALFAFTCWITWLIQHGIPGQRGNWRASRTWTGFLRAAVLVILTFPIQLLGWVALLVDKFIPSKGMYMGACVLAHKRDADTQVGN